MFNIFDKLSSESEAEELLILETDGEVLVVVFLLVLFPELEFDVEFELEVFDSLVDWVLVELLTLDVEVLDELLTLFEVELEGVTALLDKFISTA